MVDLFADGVWLANTIEFFSRPDVILEIISLVVTLLGISISYHAGKRAAEHDAAVRRVEIIRMERKAAYDALIIAMNRCLQHPEGDFDFASASYATQTICSEELNSLINEFRELMPSSFDDPNHVKARKLMPKVILAIRRDLTALDSQMLALANNKRLFREKISKD